MPSIRTVVLAGLLSLAVLQASCATINEGNAAALFEQFKSGTVNPGAFTGGVDTLNNRKDFWIRQDWAGLAKEVINKGGTDDLAWFYLGEAASGLRLAEQNAGNAGEAAAFQQAAIIYYKRSINANQQHMECNGWVYLNNRPYFRVDSCTGFTFPRDAQKQLDKSLRGG